MLIKITTVATQYDLIVIGTGAAAQVASAAVRAAGRSVAVIDHRPYGGTCALRGCEPKKVLISAAEAVDFARRMHGHGVDGTVRVDWPALMAFKRSFTDPIPAAQERHDSEQGIVAFHGAARFVGPDAIQVNGAVLRGGHIVIASGARPRPLGIVGERHVTMSEQFLELDHLPARVALIGGGYIAAEFSDLAARAGSRVTVLQRAPRLLTQFDADLVGWLTQKSIDLGIDVRLNTAAEEIETYAHGLRVHAHTAGKAVVVEADCVVHAAGRIPDLSELNLAAAQVATQDGHLQLNEFLQSTSNPAIYAAGDAAATGPSLTPVAALDGRVATANILAGNYRRAEYRHIPSISFTIPPIARVGLSEDEARRQQLPVRVKCERTGGWYTARRLVESLYGYKTLVAADTDQILGAHIVGPGADKVINLFALAMRHAIRANELKDTVFGYPTGVSDVGSML